MKPWQREKIQIPRTTIEQIWDIVGYAAFLSSIILLFIIWGNLPLQVPGQVDIAGNVERWAAKWELLILPIISFVIIIIGFFLERHPEIHNYPSRINAENAPAFYLNSRKLVVMIKNLTLITFSIITYESLALALYWPFQLNDWLLPTFSIPFILFVGRGIYNQTQIK